MSKLFVTVLGTGNYFDCYYCKDDKSFRTPFIQEALINFLYKNENKFEDFEMKILLTEKARDKNYYGENKLEAILKKYDITPELVIIPEGKTSDELWDIFDKVSETIDESASKLSSTHESLDVNIDITHSLRNIPMQIVVAMNYLTLFSNVNLEGIYYGAFELGETKIDDKFFENKSILDKLYNAKNINTTVLDKLKSADCCDDLDDDTKEIIFKNSRNYKGVTISHAPICSLDVYYDLLNWTNAINSFIKCGNTTELQYLSNTTKDIARQSKSENFKNIASLDKVVINLNHFTNCINTCRGKYVKKVNKLNSIKIASSELYKSLQNLLNDLDKNISVKPLKKLFKLVSKKIEPFIGKDNLGIGLATIDWCIEYNLYQQAYTALDESLKTLLCVKLETFYNKNIDKIEIDEEEFDKTKKITINETNADEREEIANVILTCTSKDHNYEPLSSEKIHFKKLKKEYKKKIAIESLNILSKNKDFYKFVNNVKDFRNDINHFGFGANGESSYEKLSDELLNLRDQLVKYSEGDFPWYPVEDTSEQNPKGEVAVDSSQV